MVVKIQPASSNIATLLDYNDRKVDAGVAKVVHAEGFAEATRECIQETLESRKRLSFRSDNVNFHASINPSAKDNMDERTVVEFARELMEKLGYGGQPLLIYQHSDTGRIHYHVVSSRIGPDGHMINDDFERRRCQDIMKELASKYGFSVEPPRGKKSAKTEDSAAETESTAENTAEKMAETAIAVMFSGNSGSRGEDEDYDRKVKQKLAKENHQKL